MLIEVANLERSASAFPEVRVSFVAQHANATVVMPDRAIDPAFADTLGRVIQAGVEGYAVVRSSEMAYH